MITLTFSKVSKKGTHAIYRGLRNVLRVPLGVFEDEKNPPRLFDVQGAFAPPKVAMTAEQRKEARKNKPKPTLTERIEQNRKRLAKLEAKAAAEKGEPVGTF